MFKRQSAALPYRRNAAGALEVLLVTSRRRGRWILPKGDVQRGMRPHTSAAHEAFEEAGLLGLIESTPVGEYRQRKLREEGQLRELVIHAYPLFVNTQLKSWPEMAIRRRRWMTIDEAIEAVRDRDLRTLLVAFAGTMQRREEDIG